MSRSPDNSSPTRTWVTYRIAVGPTTQSFRVTVSHDLTAPAPAFPALDQLYLVGPKGNLLAELKGASANWAGPRQDLTISLSGIPQGDQLLVRIVENPVVVPQTQAPQPAPTANLPFMMEVQRTELLTTVISSSSFSPTGSVLSTVGPLLIGYGTSALALAPTSLVLSSRSVDSNPPVSDQAATAVKQSSTPQTAEESGTGAPGVSVGPLVSRGSAPIGPMLATTPGDSTQSIDRSERAFDLATGGLGSGARLDPELLDVLAASLARPTGQGMPMGRSAGLDDASESLVALRGPGGFPLMVTSLQGDRSRVNRSELLATLPTLDDPAESGDPMAGFTDVAAIKIRRADPGPESEDPTCTDFLTAACGLALGVGLTSGPLYPDLMALVRTWLPSRLRRRNLALAVRSGRSRPSRFLARWFGRRSR